MFQKRKSKVLASVKTSKRRNLTMGIKLSHLASLTLEQRVSNIEMFARLLGALSGLSLIGILSFAFWLGTVSTKVSASTETADRVYRVVAENKDSLLVRTGVIESRLGALETRMDRLEASMDRLEARMDRLEARMDSMETKLASIDAKLNKLISLRSRTQ
jgi:tetrahydromethanopterin S-methyltransferase subunit B